LPVVYFVVSYGYMEGGVHAELAFSARTVEGLVVRNPKTCSSRNPSPGDIGIQA
jgi:hypothetical protein